MPDCGDRSGVKSPASLLAAGTTLGVLLGVSAASVVMPKYIEVSYLREYAEFVGFVTISVVSGLCLGIWTWRSTSIGKIEASKFVERWQTLIAAAVALSGAVIAVFPVVAQLKEIRTQTQLQSRETLKQMIESANKMEEIIVNIDKKFFSLAFFDGSGKRQGGFYNENGNNDQGNVLFSKESIGETRQFFDFNFSRRMLADIKGDIDRLYEAKGFNELGEAVEREILLRVDVYRKVNKLIIQHTSAGGEGKFDFYRIDGVDASVNTVRAELVSITAEVTSPVSEERISEVFSRARQPIRNKISESYRSMLE